MVSLGVHAEPQRAWEFMLNLSAPFVAQFFGEQRNRVIPFADILVGIEFRLCLALLLLST